MARRDVFDEDEWRGRLAQPDLDARQRDFDALVERARGDEAARDALERWSRDATQLEIAWSARLALREVGEAHGAHGGGPHGAQAPLQRLQRRLQGVDRMFGDLDQRFDELRKRLERDFGELDTRHATPPHAKRSSQSYSIQSGPDGVTIKVEEDVDGKREVKEYKGESLDQVLDANPELADKVRLGTSPRSLRAWLPDMDFQDMGFDVRQWFAPRAGAPRVRPDLDDADADAPFLRPAQPLNPSTPPSTPQAAPKTSNPKTSNAPPASNEVPTDKLGIVCAPIDSQRAQALGLDTQVGLEVQRVQPGTIAQLLGLQPGDVVLELDGRTTANREDVATALRERAADAELRVRIADPRGGIRTMTWRPKAKD